MIKPIENMVERLKVVKQLKEMHPYLWEKLRQDEDYDEDFRNSIISFYRDLEKDIMRALNDQQNYYINLRIL